MSLESLAILKRMRNDWVCWIVGDGAMRGQLEEQAIRTGLRHEVLFLGQHDNVPGRSANRISLSILAFKITSRTRLWKPKWQASRASYRPQGIARNGNSRFHGIVSPCRRSGKHGRAPQFLCSEMRIIENFWVITPRRSPISIGPWIL